ncbi:MAG TPA: type II toxin-antitoxin system RelE/ParE family toxin [Rhizomicrobium sp.]|nr:type II toxin-antitoxin system RelE/ParE family toxin [Rhizomicrobium sp.]
MKLAKLLGDSLERIREFPERARNEAGHQIYRAQIGPEPKDWKPLKTVGSGVREIRIRDESGAYRVIYLANVANAIYVLHAFQKKTQATSERDLALASRRYAEIARR